MKNIVISLAVILTLASCTSTPKGSSTITGNIKIIDDKGADITQRCGSSVSSYGSFSQSATTGVNNLKMITCKDGNIVYRIKGEKLSVSVNSENSVVDFGSITITLNDDITYSIAGGNNNLVVGDTSKGWSKHNLMNIR